MNKQEYEESVKDFFEREGINNLSGGYFKCPDCDIEFDDHEHCSKCGVNRESFDEPYFSWHSCDCCGTHFGGNRQYASGYNPITEEILEYEVCEDCIYYAEYGRLPDQTMLDMEDN